MKILKTIRLVLVGMMIGISCIFPIPVKDMIPPKHQTEQRESDDDIDD